MNGTGSHSNPSDRDPSADALGDNLLTLWRLDSAGDPVQRWVWDATKNSPIDVGRDLRNQVVLEAEQVSRFHAQLYWEGERWWLVNRGRNGTLVQGQFIQRLPLAPAGQFQCALGGPVLRWQHSLPYQRWQHSLPYQHSLPHQQAAVPVFLPAFPPVAPSAGAGYEILGVLGEGGMATTYLVRSGGLVRSGAFSQEAGVEGLYVLKLLHPAMQQIPKAKQLFLREAQVLQRLSHPHIPRFYDFFEISDQPHLVMEWVPGTDLEQWVITHGPARPAQAIAWMRQTCAVLEYLHRRPTPILHRDIKPSNLVLRGNRGGHPSPNPREDMMGDHMIENHIMVVDFGAVKFLSWLPGTRINAGGYSAPEQLRGKPIPASDLYSVGMTLLFLLTGRSPQDFYDHQGQVRLSDSMLRAYSISKALSDVLITATQTKPRDRYSSARELSRALYRAGQLI